MPVSKCGPDCECETSVEQEQVDLMLVTNFVGEPLHKMAARRAAREAAR